MELGRFSWKVWWQVALDLGRMKKLSVSSLRRSRSFQPEPDYLGRFSYPNFLWELSKGTGSFCCQEDGGCGWRVVGSFGGKEWCGALGLPTFHKYPQRFYLVHWCHLRNFSCSFDLNSVVEFSCPGILGAMVGCCDFQQKGEFAPFVLFCSVLPCSVLPCSVLNTQEFLA